MRALRVQLGQLSQRVRCFHYPTPTPLTARCCTGCACACGWGGAVTAAATAPPMAAPPCGCGKVSQQLLPPEPQPGVAVCFSSATQMLFTTPRRRLIGPVGSGKETTPFLAWLPEVSTISTQDIVIAAPHHLKGLRKTDVLELERARAHGGTGWGVPSAAWRAGAPPRAQSAQRQAAPEPSY